MKINEAHVVYFSPSGSTKKISEEVAKGIAQNIVYHNMTIEIEMELSFNKGDVVIVGVPSYSGRVPAIAKSRMNFIKAGGAYAILVCVYGNREYDDTLLELNQVCIDVGFLPVSAAAFIARHAIFPGVAAGRPDKQDLKEAFKLGERSLGYIGNGEIITPLKIKGSIPYRRVQSVPFTPRTNSTCKECGLCAKECPVNAIDLGNPKHTNKKICISCARCIAVCPNQSRRFKGTIYKIANMQFKHKYNKRKLNELIFQGTNH